MENLKEAVMKKVKGTELYHLVEFRNATLTARLKKNWATRQYLKFMTSIKWTHKKMPDMADSLVYHLRHQAIGLENRH